ncbi:hypothetical protein [Anaerocellum danielii]|uniref:Uncharacterized protein n=1 Tax=Anaerocellum danielii TaxID=1387557 RepID=A0ABZ0U4G6_9FIRM|nr:hypothetical protein [Caldicellulosiruptor danielii]WPX10171.1 hypothetical protein SOJ16_000905 [Caldicellulosiruptor danielii]
MRKQKIEEFKDIWSKSVNDKIKSSEMTQKIFHLAIPKMPSVVQNMVCKNYKRRKRGVADNSNVYYNSYIIRTVMQKSQI